MLPAPSIYREGEDMLARKEIKTDVLVIGGGDAGLFAAIHARKEGADVVLVDKAYAGKSGSSIMASGWMNVYNEEWNGDFNILMAGIKENGSSLADMKWAEIVMKESFGVYMECREYGCEFPASHEEMDVWYAKNMLISERRGGGHDSETANGGAPFSFIPLRHRGIPPHLRKEAERQGARIIDRLNVTELLKNEAGEICGCVGFGVESGIPHVIQAKVTIMAAGNAYYRPPGYHTSSVTGDADCMAYRAGAHIGGREFADHHFTIAKDPAWKGNGELYPAHAYYVNALGERVPCFGMDLGMTKEVHAGNGPCYWDWYAAEPDDTQALLNYSKKRGNPTETERVGLYPQDGAKIHMVGGHACGGTEEQSSGIWPVDYECRTELPRMFAAGDCLDARTWGAIKNGAPWGIMPAMVEGKIAGKAAAHDAASLDYPEIETAHVEELLEEMYAPLHRVGGFESRWIDQLLNNTMSPYYVYQIKAKDRLEAALVQVEFFRDVMVPKIKAHDYHELKMAHETKNMVLSAEMQLRSFLERDESRGRHFREDFPEEKPEWAKWILLSKEEGKMQVSTVDVPEEWKC